MLPFPLDWHFSKHSYLVKGQYSCKIQDGKWEWDDPGSTVTVYFGINTKNVGRVTNAFMRGISEVIIHESYDPKG